MRTFDTKRGRAQLLVGALGLALLVALVPFLSGLLGASVLYVACVPAYRSLGRHLGPRAAALAVVLVAVVVVCIPALWLIGTVVAEAPDALARVQASEALAKLAAVRVGGVDVGAQLSDVGRSSLAWVSRRALQAIGGAVRGTLNLVIALVGLYYLLLTAPRAWSWLADYIPFSAASAERLRQRFVLVTEATLLGTALTAVLQGALVGLGFLAVGLPSPAFWGVVTAVVSVLPVLGSAFVWLPGVIVLVAQGRYGAATVLGLLGAVVASNIDNLTRPLVNRRVSDLHPMTTLVGAFAGVNVFGLAGLLLGPLAISYFFELLRIYRLEYGVASSDPVVAVRPAESAAARSGEPAVPYER